jgi:Acetyltransferases, including N-acetylases of ribosomal proteins
MLIRNIESKDNAAVAMIAKTAFVELGAPLKNTVYDDPRTDTLYEQFAHRTDAAYFVIEDEGQVLGGCGFYPTEGLPEGVAEVVKFYFSPALRGKGMGKEILGRVEQSAREAGYQYLYLESFPEFSKAVEMYEKAGFRHLPQRMGRSGHTATTIHMIKDIR